MPERRSIALTNQARDQLEDLWRSDWGTWDEAMKLIESLADNPYIADRRFGTPYRVRDVPHGGYAVAWMVREARVYILVVAPREPGLRGMFFQAAQTAAEVAKSLRRRHGV